MTNAIFYNHFQKNEQTLNQFDEQEKTILQKLCFEIQMHSYNVLNDFKVSNLFLEKKISYLDISIYSYKTNDKAFSDLFSSFCSEILNEAPDCMSDGIKKMIIENNEFWVFSYKSKSIGFIGFMKEDEQIDDLVVKITKVIKLQIFYFSPKYRSEKLIKAFLGLIKDKARKEKYSKIDFDLPGFSVADNSDLTQLGFELKKKENLNFLSLKIPQIKLIWIRHGKINDFPNLNYFLEDEKLGLSDRSKCEIDALSSLIDFEFQMPIFVSPLKRTKETAEHLFKNSSEIVFEICEDLKEAFPAELIGLTIDQAKIKFGPNFWEIWLQEPSKFPNFQIQTIQKVLFDRIQSIINVSLPSNLRIIVSHGVLHNIFLLKLLNGNVDHSTRKIFLDHVAYSEFNYDHVDSEILVYRLNNNINKNFKEQ